MTGRQNGRIAHRDIKPSNVIEVELVAGPVDPGANDRLLDLLVEMVGEHRARRTVEPGPQSGGRSK